MRERVSMEIVKTEFDVGAVTVRGLPSEAETALATALKQLRESGGVIVRAADLLGSAIGPAASVGLRRLNVPPALVGKAQALAAAALRRAFDLAIVGVRRRGARTARLGRGGGRIVAAASGAIGGFAGLSGFLPDVMLTTLLIMRRIAAVAVEEGEDLTTEDARAACLQVFAFDTAEPARLNGQSITDREWGEPEVRYWTARFLLQGQPIVLLISEIAASYGLRVSQKLALQAVPLVGAAGGALVNSVFLDHYEKLARAHFTIRRLERVHGSSLIRSAWKELSAGAAS
jgi:EcsC protein family